MVIRFKEQHLKRTSSISRLTSQRRRAIRFQLERLEGRLLLHAGHGTNSSPVLGAVAEVGTTVDKSVEFLLTATDTDGDTVTFVASTPLQFPAPVSNFTVTPIDGRSARVRITPEAGFAGQIAVRVGARDDNHGTDAVAFSTRDMTVTVGVNQAPRGTDLDLRFGNDRIQTITLSGDDGDPSIAQSLTFMIDALPMHGSLMDMGGNPVTAGSLLNGAQVMYRAAQGYTGPDQFTYHVEDDGGTAGGGTNRSLQPAQAILAITGQTTPPPNGNPPSGQAPLGTFARLIDGVLEVRGSDEDDVIACALSTDAERIECMLNDELMDSFDVAAVRHIRIRAGAGDDEITVDPNITIPTHIRCGPGNDTATGGAGVDIIRGGRGDDMLDGGMGNDRLHGRRGNDMLMGQEGDDMVCGGSGHDTMEGGEGDDHFRPGSGNDMMDGGAGRDRMRASSGNDMNMTPDAMDHAPHAPWQQTFGPGDAPIMMSQHDQATRARIEMLEHADSIARDPADLLTAPTAATNGLVKISIEAKEVVSEIAPGVSVNYWTFDAGVPGPFLRVRQGDRVELSLHNNAENMFHHNIDLHAVTGPGGGASATNVAPGESATVTFRALNPGLYVYHCAHPNMAEHMAHGMYGLILVEPPGGLPDVDEEFYVMQGEFYVHGGPDAKGFRMFDAERMVNDDPSYTIFNGRTGEMVDRMTVGAGDDVRIFFGNGGVNRISSLHIVGEIFDRVYPEAAIGSDPVLNTDSTIVPAGGATIVELAADAPGEYRLVDQFSDVERGAAWGVLEVLGVGAASMTQHTMDSMVDPELDHPQNHATRQELNQLDHVASISHDPNDLPALPIPATGDTVMIHLHAKEAIAEVAPRVTMNYWTFDGTVPGPFLRVREGDRVELMLHNDAVNLFHHSVDLNAVAGAGAYAAVADLAPGESATVAFDAVNPGLFVYSGVTTGQAEHMAHGMFGMILVEPAAGLSSVDKEYYVMQSEAYVTGALGQTGLLPFDADAMMDGRPMYIVFNGKTGSLVDQMTVNVGDTVRIYFGNGGVILTSSFHVVGEIFDRVYPAGDFGSDPLLNVQTTAVPPSGATAVEFTTEVPGRFVLVDHALARTDRGAWGLLTVVGQENHDIFDGHGGHDHGSSGHSH